MWREGACAGRKHTLFSTSVFRPVSVVNSYLHLECSRSLACRSAQPRESQGKQRQVAPRSWLRGACSVSAHLCRAGIRGLPTAAPGRPSSEAAPWPAAARRLGERPAPSPLRPAGQAEPRPRGQMHKPRARSRVLERAQRCGRAASHEGPRGPRRPPQRGEVWAEAGRRPE